MTALCDTCGDPLHVERGGVCVLDASGPLLDIHVRDLAKVDPELAAELNLADGVLTYHTECGHKIRRYLGFEVVEPGGDA